MLEGLSGRWRVVERRGGLLPAACLASDGVEPVHDSPSGVDLLFSGRLDNRSELVGALGKPVATAESDGRLALAAYRAWGTDAFPRLVGPFALVLFDPREQRMLAVRDALGDRSLYWFRDSRRVIVASELPLVLRHPAVPREVDDTALAHFFAVQAPPPGVTFFSSVREVPPGHLARVAPDVEAVERYWPPHSIERIRYPRDADYVEHFRDLLGQAVRCRLPGPDGKPGLDGAQGEGVAVLMSGGLDSTSVAATAAMERANVPRLDSVHSISWVFDELPGADERRFIDPVVEHHGLRGHQVVGDDEWPLRDTSTWPVRAEAPWQGPYCRLQNAAYRVARENGARVLLTGEFGDHLFADSGFWLRDLLTDRGVAAAWQALWAEVDSRGPASIVRSGPARSAVSRALGWRGRPLAPPAWLTPEAGSLVAESAETWRRTPFPVPPRDRALPYPRILDPLCALASSLEHPMANRAGIDLRRPYRDRRLIEFLLAIPAHLLQRPGATKWILRQAMRGVLPEPVRERRWVSSLLPLSARGLVEHEAEEVDRILRRPDAVWRRFVDADWLTESFPRRLRLGLDGIESVVAWQCICSQVWFDSRGDQLMAAK